MAGLSFDRMEEMANLRNYQLRESVKQASMNRTVKRGKSKGIFIER